MLQGCTYPESLESLMQIIQQMISTEKATVLAGLLNDKSPGLLQRFLFATAVCLLEVFHAIHEKPCNIIGGTAEMRLQ